MQPAEPAVAPAVPTPAPTVPKPTATNTEPGPAPTQPPAPAKPAEPAVAPPVRLLSQPQPLVQPQPRPLVQTPSPTPPPSVLPTAPSTAPKVAMIPPAPMLQQIAQALRGARCALADAVVQDSGTLSVNGLADAATMASLRRDSTALPARRRLPGTCTMVDPVFCPALALLRPISALTGAPGPGVGLTLKGNRTVLHDGEAILPRVTMPDFAGELRVDYLAHDGTLAHLYPTLADPADKLAAQPARWLSAGERLSLGDPGPGKPQWQSGEPYGTDMIIAVASSAPLHVAAAQNAEEKAAGYLASLARAIDQARAGGARVSGAVLLVDAIPKAK